MKLRTIVVTGCTQGLGYHTVGALIAAGDGEGALRVVNVSSEVHDPANKTPLPDPQQHWPTSEDEYDRLLARGEPIDGETPRDSGGRRYSRSKLCNVFFTNELARRLATGNRYPAAKRAQVLAFNPGLMLDTGFFSGIVGKFGGTVARWLTPIARLTSMGTFMRSGPASGPELARIATANDLPVLTAAYYDGPSLKLSSEFSLSEAGRTQYQRELWTHSLRWAGVTTSELDEAGFEA